MLMTYPIRTARANFLPKPRLNDATNHAQRTETENPPLSLELSYTIGVELNCMFQPIAWDWFRQILTPGSLFQVNFTPFAKCTI